MSGGHWDFEQHRAECFLNDVGNDNEIIKRFPKLALTFSDLAELIGKVAHDLDWDLSGDSNIENDKLFERDFIEKLGVIISKKLTAKYMR